MNVDTNRGSREKARKARNPEMFNPDRPVRESVLKNWNIALTDISTRFSGVRREKAYINPSGARFQTFSAICPCGERTVAMLTKDYVSTSTVRRDRLSCAACAEYGYRRSHIDGGVFYIANELSETEIGFGITHVLRARRASHRKVGVEVSHAFHHPNAAVAERIERQLKVLVLRDQNRPAGFITEALPSNFLDIILSLVSDAGMTPVAF